MSHQTAGDERPAGAAEVVPRGRKLPLEQPAQCARVSCALKGMAAHNTDLRVDTSQNCVQ